MSGHSKWSSIKHKKGAADAKRGKLFSKLTRAIIVAAKEGGPDPAGNLALQNAIEKARAASMPKDNIDRAIAKGAGTDADSAAYETVVYEGYGPAGVAVIVESLTDNRNRTAGEVRHTFAKNDGNLGTSGAVAWLFERRGLVLVPADGTDEDELMLAAAEGGADDVSLDGSSFEVLSAAEQLATVREAVAGAGFEIESAELTMLPKTTVAVEDENEAKKILRLIDQLEENDDVQEVYANFDIPERVLGRHSDRVRRRVRAAGVVRRRSPNRLVSREGRRHRSGDCCLRVRSRPRKRRPPQGGGARLLVDARRTGHRPPFEDDPRRRGGAHCRARAGCGGARGVVRRRRRPHRALRRAGTRRRARRGRQRGSRLPRVRARQRQAGDLRLRPCREGADAADGEDGPRPCRATDAASCRRRARGRDLPRARAAAAAGSRLEGTSVPVRRLLA